MLLSRITSSGSLTGDSCLFTSPVHCSWWDSVTCCCWSLEWVTGRGHRRRLLNAWCMITPFDRAPDRLISLYRCSASRAAGSISHLLRKLSSGIGGDVLFIAATLCLQRRDVEIRCICGGEGQIRKRDVWRLNCAFGNTARVISCPLSSELNLWTSKR